MKQSRLMSLVESLINVAVGFGISCAAQAIFLPMLGVPIPWNANLAFALIMTVISIARSWGLRRLFEAFHIRRPLSPFMQAVIAERFRQVDIEGWSAEHDDKEHAPGEIAIAGAAYAAGAGKRWPMPPTWWPWAREWWKPVDFRRDLVKAGALILAEGEKFDRRRKYRRADASLVAPLAPAAWRGKQGPRLVEFAHGKTASEHGGASV
jgi:hypothetical protein